VFGVYKMAHSYEKEQKHLEELMQVILSDEENEDPFANVDSSDEWEPEKDDSSSDEELSFSVPKRRKGT
jgi:uncharacterized membrane-anchored protein YhcB (DUF1043 family)